MATIRQSWDTIVASVFAARARFPATNEGVITSMKFRTLFLLLILGATAGFSALNWERLHGPDNSFSGGDRSAGADRGDHARRGQPADRFFLLFVIYVQASALFDSRRHAQELKANQELADRAEASRFTDLRGFITTELQAMARQQATPGRVALTRRFSPGSIASRPNC
jgi:hypothetical protein